jgi:murein L,D-transpeptidase YafK
MVRLGALVLIGALSCDRAIGSAEARRLDGARESGAEPEPQDTASKSTATKTTTPKTGAIREPTDWRADRDWSPEERQKGATARRAATVRALFDEAQVSYPPAQLLFRGFKDEGELEVWASSEADQPLTMVATYRVCRASGGLGPKRREGDWQVPEGFYRVANFNPASKFHLSLLMSYPNDSDRLLGDRDKPGGEIMIHGNCRSRGCLAMSDERIEELWLMARASKRPVMVHLFPARDIPALYADHPEHRAFWENLDAGKRLFEEKHRLPRVSVDSAGRYQFE